MLRSCCVNIALGVCCRYIDLASACKDLHRRLCNAVECVKVCSEHTLRLTPHLAHTSARNGAQALHDTCVHRSVSVRIPHGHVQRHVRARTGHVHAEWQALHDTCAHRSVSIIPIYSDTWPSISVRARICLCTCPCGMQQCVL